LSRAGYTVLTTCSPRNFDLCKSRGAEAVFDYTDPECGEKIYQYTNGRLQYIFDTIGSDDGVKICMDALSKDASIDKRYGTLLFNDIPRKDVKKSFTVLVTFAGEAFGKFGKHFPASVESFKFAEKFTTLTERLVAEGKLLANPVRSVDRGLLGMLEEGVPLGESGTISGEKIVARVADTL
jgi:hypothetical protein